MSSTDNLYGHGVISVDTLKKMYSDIVECKIQVSRRATDGQIMPLSLDQLHSLVDGKAKSLEGETLYINNNWRKQIEEHKKELSGESILEQVPEAKKDVRSIRGDMEEKSSKEKASELANKKAELEKIADKGAPLDEEDAKKVLEASEAGNAATSSAVSDALQSMKDKSKSEQEVQNDYEAIAGETRGLVYTTVKIMRNQPSTLKVFNSLKGYADGDAFSHSNRVFLDFVEFLIFYNKTVNSGYINRLRIKFRSEYKAAYKRLFKYEKIHALEDVFERGMSRISDQEVTNYCVAALVHDIGKLVDKMELDESNKFDFSQYKRHAIMGYNLVVKTSRYPKEVALTVGLHHDYYGHPAGFSLLRSFMGKMTAKDVDMKMRYAITQDFHSLLEFKAMGYLPAKLLEIVDIYDMIYSHIVQSSAEAKKDTMISYRILKTMRAEFIEKNFYLDPVLFDMFLDFRSAKDGDNVAVLRIGKNI